MLATQTLSATAVRATRTPAPKLRRRASTRAAMTLASEDTQTFDPPFTHMAVSGALPPSVPVDGQSLGRQNFTAECEEALNAQVNVELTASYVYMSLASYFSRDGVALPGLAAHFAKESDDERAHAQQLIDYQTLRGGRAVYGGIVAPPSDFANEQRGDALHACELALALEKLTMESLLHLHAAADEAGDAAMIDWVEGMMLEPQVRAVDEAARLVTQFHRVGKGLGTYQLDQSMVAPVA